MPEIRTLAARDDGLRVGAVTGNMQVAGEEEGDDGGDLRGQEEQSRICRGDEFRPECI